MLRQRNMNNFHPRMKQNFLTLWARGHACPSLLLLMLLVFMAGCASSRTTPWGQTTPHPAAATASPEPAAKPQEDLPPGISKPSAPFEGEGWHAMFDGQTLAGWRETPFAGRGEVQCRSGVILLNMGDPFTGINWTNELPRVNYEIALDAMRVMGSDFFCGLTVPVGDDACSLIVGGWGGSLLGISSIDGMDASENETTKFANFETGRWYRIRLRVTEGRLQAWVDQDKLIDVDIKGRKISTRPGDIELSKPIGLAAWQTSSAVRQIKWRSVSSAGNARNP